ncbi:hypothetical protein ACETRX_22780 [Labrys portucalensis]|uniref:Type II toxin-antitoxin system HicA family toxin n=1 Tax=Labrys neptuniae TaxID=376174 RepID=A0ABV6ZJY9_9HYPH
MNRDQVIRRLKKLAKKTGTPLQVETNKGKGSHYRVTYGAKTSTLQHDLNPGRIERFLKQLDIDPAAF